MKRLQNSHYLHVVVFTSWACTACPAGIFELVCPSVRSCAHVQYVITMVTVYCVCVCAKSGEAWERVIGVVADTHGWFVRLLTAKGSQTMPAL